MMSAAIGAAEAQGTWSTAQLGVARNHLAAISVGNLAIFAGGLVYSSSFTSGTESDAVDLYNSVSGTWSTARLSVPRLSLSATSAGNTPIFAAGIGIYGTANMGIKADLYNSATGTWSTARLSLGRKHLAATSVGNVAIFAGGFTGT